MRALGLVITPEAVQYARQNPNISIDLNELTFFDAIPQFSVSGYFDNKGYQLQQGIELVSCS